MNKQELRELILDQKEQGKQSFNQLDDDKQNQIVSAMINDLPPYRRFECMEDISMEQLQRLIAFYESSENAKTQAIKTYCHTKMGQIICDILKQNMKSACEAEYENTAPDYEAANIDDRIDAIQARRFA